MKKKFLSLLLLAAPLLTFAQEKGLDQKIDDWHKTIELLPTSWKKLTELKRWDSKGVVLFQVHKTPTFYILDSQLKIIGKPADIHELIKELKFLIKT